MCAGADTPLSEFTTLGLGGPAGRLLHPRNSEELIEVVAAADGGGEPTLLIAGGSNLVVADQGFAGTAIRVVTTGLEERPGDAGDERRRLRVAAGESWERLVERCVADDLAGIECLSGIPGSVGATPVQNVGAYGQEVSETIASVRVYDRENRETVELGPEQCGFCYRSSLFKRSGRYLVLEVEFELERSGLSRPLRYAELARTLGVEPGERAPLAEVREAVLNLRRGKGMVLDPGDPDSVSAGSFFVNPILERESFDELEHRVIELLGSGVRPPAWPAPGGEVKSSAAWLIERAGFERGYGDGRAGISSKHTLALINRGGASTAELLTLAREIRDGVRDRFGITLQAEPKLVGVEL